MKIVVFAGTTEGKVVAELFADNGFDVYVTVATEYGKDIFEEFLKNKKINILEGRLNIDEMKNLIKDSIFVVDATHPYAVEVSKNIVIACEQEGKNYMRIVRENKKIDIYEDSIIWADDQEDAIRIMNELDGNILLTTGSKDLPIYTNVRDYHDRLFPRILPDIISLEIAFNNNYKKKNIICMQGPFTHDANVSMMRMINAKYLLTKETGDTGGYKEKLSACEAVGAKAIVIKKPIEELEKQKDNVKIKMISIEVREIKEYLNKNKITLDSNDDFKKIEKEIVDFDDIKNFLNEYKKNYLFSDSKTKVKKEEVPRFPLFISLDNKNVVVIGSGKIAQRRINTLLKYNANVKVISPNASENIKNSNIIDKNMLNNIIFENREYEDGDISNVVVAVAATNNRDVNHKIYISATKQNIPVSVADSKEESNFYFPAIWAKNGLSLGLVGDGTDHSYVRKSADLIRETIERLPLKEFRRNDE